MNDYKVYGIEPKALESGDRHDVSSHSAARMHVGHIGRPADLPAHVEFDPNSRAIAKLKLRPAYTVRFKSCGDGDAAAAVSRSVDMTVAFPAFDEYGRKMDRHGSHSGEADIQSYKADETRRTRRTLCELDYREGAKTRIKTRKLRPIARILAR